MVQVIWIWKLCNVIHKGGSSHCSKENAVWDDCEIKNGFYTIFDFFVPYYFVWLFFKYLLCTLGLSFWLKKKINIAFVKKLIKKFNFLDVKKAIVLVKLLTCFMSFFATTVVVFVSSNPGRDPNYAQRCITFFSTAELTQPAGGVFYTKDKEKW